jgi:hypothetical protein
MFTRFVPCLCNPRLTPAKPVLQALQGPPAKIPSELRYVVHSQCRCMPGSARKLMICSVGARFQGCSEQSRPVERRQSRSQQHIPYPEFGWWWCSGCHDARRTRENRAGVSRILGPTRGLDCGHIYGRSHRSSPRRWLLCGRMLGYLQGAHVFRLCFRDGSAEHECVWQVWIPRIFQRDYRDYLRFIPIENAKYNSNAKYVLPLLSSGP